MASNWRSNGAKSREMALKWRSNLLLIESHRVQFEEEAHHVEVGSHEHVFPVGGNLPGTEPLSKANPIVRPVIRTWADRAIHPDPCTQQPARKRSEDSIARQAQL